MKRLLRMICGLSMMGFALTFAIILMSALAVILNFTGNAVLPSQCAAVFGSAVHRGGEAGPGITRRIETAVRLMEEGSVERIIVTGGIGEGNYRSEARVMQKLAVRLGVDRERIQLEEQSHSTWESVRLITPLVQECAGLVGISDRYHLARIRLIAWQQGLDMSVHPSDRTAGTLFELQNVLREALGLLFYLVVGVS